MAGILRRFAETYLGLPEEYAPNPKGSIAITAQEMYERVKVEGFVWKWNDHRLVQVGADRLSQVNGQWPYVGYVDFLEDGEGGQPTVYLSSERDDGTYCLHPTDFVVLLPPGHGED